MAFSFHLQDFDVFTHSPAPILNLASEVYFEEQVLSPVVLSAAPTVTEHVINIVS